MANFLGTNNNDTLQGSSSADYMVGYAGNDVMNGGAGNDGIYGGSGNDVINGGAGNDLISGQGGADVLTGGLGYDTFLFKGATSTAPNDSVGPIGDHILDFTEGYDKIQFSGVSSKTVIQVLEADGDLLVKFGTPGGAPGPYQGSITLENFGHYLDANNGTDFIFT